MTLIVYSNLNMANPQYWTVSKCELRDHKINILKTYRVNVSVFMMMRN